MSDPVLQPRLLAPVLPTRVRRNYRGGRLLDEIEGRPHPADSDRPESWIASTTAAVNAGMAPIAGEGLTRVGLPGGGETTLPALLASAPEFYLGSAHVTARGTQLGFLAKLLDSAIRLHVQAHPTADFARRLLGSPYGKLEVYYVLGVRSGTAGQFRLGFQHAPERAEWRRIIAEQDIAAMDRCFEPVAVRPGETWIVPGGMPHAIGEGVLMVEIMEPSDWVVRCEFKRGDALVPPEARFMGRDLEFCLDVFDYRSCTVEEVRRRCELAPVPMDSGPGWALDRVVGADRTRCFVVDRVRASRPAVLPGRRQAAILIQTGGRGEIAVKGESLALATGQCCLVAAAAPQIEFRPGGDSAQWLICSPA